MLRRTARRGSVAGQSFWGCARYPACRGVVGIAQSEEPSEEATAAMQPGAGASAQAEYNRRLIAQRTRIRRAWPVVVGASLVLMFGAYLLVNSYQAGPGWAGLAAIVVGAIAVLGFLQLPSTTSAWRVGAQGERRTASYLVGLEQAGFVVLHDRRVPGYGGNLDHVAIGPSGVWAIETKSLSARVEIEGDRLMVAGRRQERIVDQAFKEATAVQIALRDVLDKLGMTVTPVLCMHRSRLPWFNKTVRGVQLVSGSGLVRLLKEGEQRLSPEQVQVVARVASRLLLAAKG